MSELTVDGLTAHSRHLVLSSASGCGSCGPSRWLEDGEGRPVSRCPNCHPSIAPAPTSVRAKAIAVRSMPNRPSASVVERTDVPAVPSVPSWETADRTVSWTAEDLLSTEFPPPRWAVPGIVAEGVTVLAGAPKVGKSWLALGLAAAVASGGKALGKVDVEPGPALYLGLEDTGRRLQTRLSTVLAGARPPRGLTCVIECPTLVQGGAAQIAMWLEANPTARLVVVDVFTKLRGRTPPGSAYEADYNAVGQLKHIADRYGVPFLVVHHTRKAGAEDFLEELSGTNGLAGAADAIVVLRRMRGRADGVLQVTGRDVEEAEHALSFDSVLGQWSMLDKPVAELTMSDTRGQILAFLREEPGQTPKRISAATGIAYELTKKSVKRMADDAQLHTDGRGHYFVTEPETAP